MRFGVVKAVCATNASITRREAAKSSTGNRLLFTRRLFWREKGAHMQQEFELLARMLTSAAPRHLHCLQEVLDHLYRCATVFASVYVSTV